MAQLFVVEAKFLLESKITFIEHIIHEDNPYCTALALKSNRTYLNHIPLYNYMQSENSITRTKLNKQMRIKKIDAFFAMVSYYSSLANEYEPNSPIHNALIHFCCVYMYALAQHLKIIGYHQGQKPTRKDLIPYMRFLKRIRKLYILFPKTFNFLDNIKHFLKS